MTARSLGLLPLLGVLATGRGIPQDAVLLAGFEKAAEIEAAAISRAQFELAGEGRAPGRRALRLTFEAVPEGQRAYPAFVLQGDALARKDFSRFGALAFWVKNLEADDAEISVMVRDGAGRRGFPRPSTFAIKPGGWQRIECQLVLHGLDPREIGSVHFFQNVNRRRVSVLLDDVELLSPLAGRIAERRQEVLENLELARRNSARVGLEAMVGPEIESLSKSVQAIVEPNAVRAMTAGEQLAGLSRAAQEAANLAGSISFFDSGRGLTLGGAKVTDAWLEGAKRLSGITRMNILGTAITDAGLAHLQGLELHSLALQGKSLTGTGLAALPGSKLVELSLEGSGVHDAALVHLERFPELRHLNLAYSPVTGAALEHVARLAKLESLFLDGTATTDEGLAHLRGLTLLETLSLHETRVTGAGLAHLKEMKGLKTLGLKKTRVTDAGVEALRGLPALEGLELGGTDVIGVGLARRGGFEKLAALDLTATRINDSIFAGLGTLGNLKRLEVSSTRITDATLVLLSAACQLGYLDLYGTNVTDAGLRLLASQRDLQELYLGGTAATDTAAGALKELGGLERLDLRGTRITDAGLQALAGLKNLVALNLADTPITGSGIVHLKGIEKLQSLDLSGTEAGDEALAEVAHLRGLRLLNLGGTRVTDAGLEHILKLEKLRELGLEGTQVSDGGVAPLSKLRELRELRLDETAIGDAGLAALQGAKNLLHLSLSRTRISDAGMARLGEQLRTLILRHTAVADAGVGQLKGKDRLQHLDLAGTDITPRALEALAGLPNLRVVDLSGTRATDAGLRFLSSLGGLEELRLDHTAVTDAGVESLVALPRLSRLSLEGARVSAQGKMLLRRKRPELAVVLDRPWNEGASLSRFGIRAEPGGSPRAETSLAKLRELASTRSLRLHAASFENDLLPLLKDLPNLEHLDLRGTAIEDRALVHFIELQRLLSLNLSHTKITDAGLMHLKDLQGLTRLDLEGTAIHGPGLRSLEPLVKLQSLNLREAPLADEGAAALAGLPALRRLELTNTRLTDRGVEILARLAGVRYLDLYGTAITDEAMALIARMSELEHLYLGATAVSDAGLKALAGRNQLVELGLEGTAVTDAGCAALEGYLRVERLCLGGTSITDRALEHIQKLPALRILELEKTRISDAGLRRLLRVATIERLVLDDTAIGDAALEALVRLPALESVSVRGTAVTGGGAAEFRRRRPRVALVTGEGETGPSLPGIAATIAYLLLALAICVYGCHRYWLAWLFARDRGARLAPPPATRLAPLPRVTVQLPMFNERRVAERIIEAACAIDYPKDRLQVQVLDDSTDDSSNLARASCERFRAAGFDIEYLHRDNRAGFKGGALASGLRAATGELIAIFDADFVPPADFLQRTVHYFTEVRVGMVQTEWAHLNRGESLLTQCQAMFLDGHFVIEQAVRHRNGRWFNFNGTAGIWRRRCIEEAGGWRHDTLTEDTDLSYRAQLAGWRFVYLPSVRSSAELPSTLSAFLGQQQRWTKGLVQNAVQLLPRILRSEAPAAVKTEAWFHLTSPLLYVVMFLLTALALPAMLIPMPLAELRALPALAIGMGVLLLGTLAAATFLVTAQRALGLSPWRALARLPALMALGIGMSAANARAAIEALLGVRGPFVRTPKFNGRTDFDPDPAARRRRGVPAGLLELAAAGVMVACLVLTFRRSFTIIGAPFLLLFACGYFWVGAASLLDAAAARRAALAARGGRRRGARTACLTVAAATTLAVAAAVLAFTPSGGGSRSGGEDVLTLGVDLSLAKWTRRGAAIEGIASSPTGLELDVALDRDHDAGEIFLELDGSLAALGDSFAAGREVRFEVVFPARFSGELQAFAADARGRAQYGTTVFVERRDALREATVALSPNRRTPPMGYSDPDFDPREGIRRVGLKVSAQSDRVRRRGYRSFRGIVTIANVGVADRQPAAAPEIRMLPPERVLPAAPVPAAQFLAQSGVDRPWPFGYGFSGPVSDAHRRELEVSFAAIAGHGLGFTRVYLGDYRTGLEFDEEGKVSGIDGKFLDCLDAIAEAASRHAITVMFSLTDNTIADGKGVEYRELIADPVASERFVKNALVPIVLGLAKRAVIFDLFNEPENVTEVPPGVVQEYVDRALRLLRDAAPEARLTVVSRSREELIYWRGRGLDLLSHNVFDTRTLAAAASGGGAPGVDAPLMIAEMDPALATAANLEALRRAGYRGVGLWGWGTEDRYEWQADDLDRVVAPLLETARAAAKQ